MHLKESEHVLLRSQKCINSVHFSIRKWKTYPREEYETSTIQWEGQIQNENVRD